MTKNKKSVRFNENPQIKEFAPKLDKNSDIYSVKRKIINIVDDEVENETKLLTETQFLVKKTPHGKDSKYEITGFVNKTGEYITEPEQIKQNLRLYAFAEFADLQKNILGKFDKEDNLKISKNFEADEEIVLRKDGKLLFAKTEKGLVNRQGELKEVNKILQKGRFFFEDSGKDIKVPKNAINPNGKPKKPILQK